MNRMRTTLLLLAAACLALASCRRTDSPPPADDPATDTNLVFVAMMERSIAKQKESESGFAIVEAIRRFQRDNRRQPTNLAELVVYRYLDKIPVPREGWVYTYDSAYGAVSVEPAGGMRRMTQEEMEAADGAGEEEEAPMIIPGLDIRP